MGMFDTVVVNCPNCSTIVDFQSKAGDCVLDTYKISYVPIKIALDLNGSYTECTECGESITLRCSTHVSMLVA